MSLTKYLMSTATMLGNNRNLAWLLCFTLLSACGFKLRGAYDFPQAMQSTYVQAENAGSDLVRALKRSLQENNVEVLAQAADNAAILKIYKETRTKRIASVDSRGRAREYTLSYAVSFSVRAEHATFEIDEQLVTIERDFLFDPEDVLGNSREESQLFAEMQQDLLRLILLRLQSKA